MYLISSDVKTKNHAHTSHFSGSSVSEIAKEASEKLSVNPEDCVIFEMKSTGEKVIFKESDTCIITTISHNGR